MRVRLRRLHLDGRTYTWWAEIRYVSGRREVRLRAWGAGKNSQALQVDLRVSDPTHLLADWTYPTPEDVRWLLAEGLAQGWQPDATGGTLTLPPHLVAPPTPKSAAGTARPNPVPAS
jgi:hypothetical protein